MSALSTILAPFILAMATESPMWSPWPWVIITRSTLPSFFRSFRSFGVFGFLVMNGSITITLPPGVASFSADCPNHWISAASAVVKPAASTNASADKLPMIFFINMVFLPKSYWRRILAALFF